MNDSTIYKKIQQTKLFSDAQKVEVLVAVADASPEDIAKLEAGIDVFDEQYGNAIAKHVAQIQSLLGHTVKDMTPEEKKEQQAALRTIGTGLGLLSS
jgi:hypothetical protein